MSWKTRAKIVGEENASTPSWQQRAKVESVEPTKADLVQEQSPLISTTDRLKIKNLSNSDESAIKYLQQKNPGADVRMVDGQLAIKAPGEDRFKVLDPDTGFFSKDILSDAGDIGYDVADGVATTAGTILGALGGAAATVNPIGAIAGGSLGGGATGAASEAMRQKLGQMAGLPQEVDGTDVALSGAFGAASPLIFGQGAEGKAALKAAGGINTIKKALGMTAKETADELARRASVKGAIPWALSKTPSVLGFMSGKGKDAMGRLSTYGDYIDQVEKNGNATEEKVKAAEEAAKELLSRKNAVGSAAQQEIAKISRPLDVTPVAHEFQAKIDELEKMTRTPDVQAKIDLLKSALDNSLLDTQAATPEWSSLLTQSASPHVGSMSGPDAFNLKQSMKPYMDLGTEIMTKSGPRKNDPILQSVAGKSYGLVNDAINNATGTTGAMNAEYEALSRLQDGLAPYIKDEKAAINAAKTITKDGSNTASENLYHLINKGKALGLKSMDALERAGAADEWANAPYFIRRQVPSVVAGAGLGYLAGANSGIGQGGAGVGAAAGGALGGVMGSPGMVKFLVRGAAKTSQAASKATPQVIKDLPLPPRTLMSRGLYDYLADDKN